MSTTVSYKGSNIATVNNNTKVLNTAGKYLEGDITLVDVSSGGGITPTGTLQITENGTYDVTSYASAEVSVSGGGGSTRTTIVPEQTANYSDRYNQINFVAPLVVGEVYIYTIDGVESQSMAFDNYGSVAIGSPETTIGFEYANGTMYLSIADSSLRGTHTVKVEQESSGGGGGMSTETIIPSQSIDCSTSLGSDVYGGYIQSYTEYIENEEEYIVTFDGTEYFARGHYRSSSILVVGDYYLTAGTSYNEFPFCIILQGGSLFYLAVQGTGTHTLKVDKILSYSGGGGSSATLITKSITANGTYSAEDDSADGYSEVTVNVAGGASNIVTGTFKGTTTGAAMDVNLNYSGSGYPIAVMIFPSNVNESTFQSTIQRYAVRDCMLEKYAKATSPSYSGTGDADSCAIVEKYKSSASNAGSYSNGGSTNVTAKLYADEAAGNTLQTLVKIRSNKKLSVYIASSSYGFMANIEYSYVVIYSS